MKIIKTNTLVGKRLLEDLKNRMELDSSEEKRVKEIIKQVKKRGDRALCEYAKKFDGIELEPSAFQLSKEEWEEGVKRCPKEIKDVIDVTARRLEEFYKRTVYNSWFYYDNFGSLLGNRVLPLERVLVYAPGGKATYPSSVLMGAIPARMAGVVEILLTTPMRREGISQAVLYAAKRAGVDRIYKLGGAQAIAAFAFGTETLPKVDKVVGPGNIYVATAKKLLYGIVDIDMVAGPSEVVVIFDGSAPLNYVAQDMLSQLEHDEDALAMAITPYGDLAKKLIAILKEKAEDTPRKKIVEKSLGRSVIFVVNDLEEAASVANTIAPEHLEIMTEDPFSLLPLIKNAGAVFLGKRTPEAIGDYIAGPNHILPTGGTARFFSPLGVESFLRRMSIIAFSEAGLTNLADHVIKFANEEGLYAHGESVKERLKDLSNIGKGK